MKMNTEERSPSLDLIKQVLGKWSSQVPEAKVVLDEQRLSRFNEADVEIICDVLLKELIATGLNELSEPTLRGLELEAAIDWIRASSRRSQ